MKASINLDKATLQERAKRALQRPARPGIQDFLTRAMLRDFIATGKGVRANVEAGIRWMEAHA